MKKVTIIEATSQDAITGDHARLRVAAYARVSTEEDEQKNSLAAQREHFERLFDDHPEWVNAGIYYDEGITGTSMKKRDGFNNLISDAMSGQFDRILVKSISRFARNTVDTLQTIRMLKDIGVSVYFEKENMDSMDLKSEFVLTIMSSLAQEESISISENVKWGLRQTYAKGNAHAPYAFLLGYKAKPGEKHTLVIDKEQAKYVRLIYRLFLEGYSEHYIAKHLTDLGVPSMRDGSWGYPTIRNILTNEKYCGDAIMQKTFISDAISKKKRMNKGQLPKYFIENDHPAIIKKATWLEVKEIYKRKQNGYRCSKHALSGKIECDVCKGRFIRGGRPDSYCRENLAIWVCHTYKANTCGNIRVYEVPLLDLCRKALLRLIKQYSSVKYDLSAVLSKVVDDQSGVSKIESSAFRFSDSQLDPETEEKFIRILIRRITVYKNRKITIEFIDGSRYTGKVPNGRNRFNPDKSLPVY